MSIESALAYIERLKTDNEFRKRVFECKDAEERMRHVIKEGFEFTQSEIKQLSRALRDDDLKQIAGGRGRAERICLDFPCGNSDWPQLF